MFDSMIDDWPIWLFGVGAVASVVAFVWLTILESREWQQFATAHACKVVGKMRGDTFTTVGPTSNGGVAVGVGSTSSKTGYQCDDGVTYWR